MEGLNKQPIKHIEKSETDGLPEYLQMYEISGQDKITEFSFNRYLKKYRLEEFLNELGYKFINIDFSSVYYIGSRFLRELVTDYKSFEGFTNPISKGRGRRH